MDLLRMNIAPSAIHGMLKSMCDSKGKKKQSSDQQHSNTRARSADNRVGSADSGSRSIDSISSRGRSNDSYSSTGRLIDSSSSSRTLSNVDLSSLRVRSNSKGRNPSGQR